MFLNSQLPRVLAFQFADHPAPIFSFLCFFPHVQGVEAKTSSFCSLHRGVETVLLCISILWTFPWSRSLTLSCARSEGCLFLGISRPAQSHLRP